MGVESLGLPVIAVRVMEGRTGSTLVMGLLGSSPLVVFDRGYPAEYRFLSYFARMADQMTEPFDAARHVGVTPFFFGTGPTWGPVPFDTEIVELRQLVGPLLASMWTAWSEQARATHPEARYYAEKIAVPVEAIVAAGITVRVIDLVRDPRDTLASIRAFTANGIDGFDRQPEQSETDYLNRFITRVADQLDRMSTTPPAIDRLVLRYEDVVRDLSRTVVTLGAWLGVELAANAVKRVREDYRHHMTTSSIEESIGRYLRDLTPEEAQTITVALGPPLEPFGYKL